MEASKKNVFDLSNRSSADSSRRRIGEEAAFRFDETFGEVETSLRDSFHSFPTLLDPATSSTISGVNFPDAAASIGFRVAFLRRTALEMLVESGEERKAMDPPW